MKVHSPLLLSSYYKTTLSFINYKDFRTTLRTLVNQVEFILDDYLWVATGENRRCWGGFVLWTLKRECKTIMHTFSCRICIIMIIFPISLFGERVGQLQHILYKTPSFIVEFIFWVEGQKTKVAFSRVMIQNHNYHAWWDWPPLHMWLHAIPLRISLWGRAFSCLSFIG